jgi:hypothetical protein
MIYKICKNIINNLEFPLDIVLFQIFQHIDKHTINQNGEFCFQRH